MSPLAATVGSRSTEAGLEAWGRCLVRTRQGHDLWMSQALAQPLLGHREAVARVCRELGIERLEVFGSAADGRFDPGRSDFDFIIRLMPAAPGLQGSLGRRFVGFADVMEALPFRPVDLMTDKPIRNPYRRSTVEASRRVVYERTATQASA